MTAHSLTGEPAECWVCPECGSERVSHTELRGTDTWICEVCGYKLVICELRRRQDKAIRKLCEGGEKLGEDA